MRTAKVFLSFIIHFFLFSSVVFSQTLLTRAEKSDFTETTRHEEVVDFLQQLQQQSQNIKVTSIGKSTEGRHILLAILGNPVPTSPSQLTNKHAIFVQANIHAGEVEGKEAMLMLMRDILSGDLGHLLENQALLFIPNFNPDGNERIDKKNRRNQLGPEGGVGIRYNGQNLDLNRDFIKVESPENSATLKFVLNRWDPMLLIDLHTTNGSYHQEPLTFATSHNPNGNQLLPNYVREKLFVKVATDMESRYNYSTVYYGYFMDRSNPTKGWSTVGHQSFYSTNYWGLRNRFSILNENYAYADYETRVRACYRFIQLILEYTREHGQEMMGMIHKVDAETVARGLSADTTAKYGLDFEAAPCEKPILIKSYEFEKYTDEGGRERARKTDRLKDYKIPFYGKFRVTKQITLPKGYLFSANLKDIASKLQQHGVVVEQLSQPIKLFVESFQINEINSDERLYQGHRRTSLKGIYKMVEEEFPANTYFVGMDQPLADLAAQLLEPESDGGLVRWNFFDRYIRASQWGRRFNPFPVYRVMQPIKVAKRILATED